MQNNSVTKQIFWFSFINYLGVAIGIVSTLFIYPENPEFLGIIRTIESYSQVIFPIVLIGASQALVHFYSTLTGENKNRLFLYSLYSVFINAILVAIGIWLFSLLFDFDFIKWIWIALPIGISIAFNEVFKRQALNIQKIAFPSLFEKIIPKLVLPLIFVLVGVQFIQETQGIWIFVFIYFAILILTSIYTLKKDNTKWDVTFKNVFTNLNKKEYFRYSLFAFTGSLGSLLAFRIDTIMLDMLDYSMSEIGIYSIGIMIASTLIIPAVGIFAINSPVISELVKENKIKELSVKYTENAKLLFVIGAVLYSCVLLGVNDLFLMLPAKENLILSIPTILVLGLGMVINMGTGFNSEIITFSEYYRFNVIAILIMIGLNIGLNLLFLLVFEMGIIGVAYSSFVSISVFNLMKTLYIKQKFGLLPFDKKYLQLIAIILSVGIILYFIPNIDSNLWNLVLKSGLCLVLNLFIIYKLKLVYQFNNFKKFKF